MLKGCDIYHGDNVPTAQMDFIYFKASEGTSFKDPTFANRWTSMKGKTLRGAYHFFHPEFDATIQANLFRSVVPGTDPGECPPSIDLEITGGMPPQDILQSSLEFIKLTTALFGRKPIIYGPRDFLASLGFPDQSYPLWLASPGVTNPTLPSPWTSWTMLQYSWSPIDLDYFNGDATLLAQLGKP